MCSRIRLQRAHHLPTHEAIHVQAFIWSDPISLRPCLVGHRISAAVFPDATVATVIRRRRFDGTKHGLREKARRSTTFARKIKRTC